MFVLSEVNIYKNPNGKAILIICKKRCGIYCTLTMEKFNAFFKSNNKNINKYNTFIKNSPKIMLFKEYREKVINININRPFIDFDTAINLTTSCFCIVAYTI